MKLDNVVITMTSIKIDESNKIEIYGIRNPITLTIYGFIFVLTNLMNECRIVKKQHEWLGNETRSYYFN